MSKPMVQVTGGEVVCYYPQYDLPAAPSKVVGSLVRRTKRELHAAWRCHVLPFSTLTVPNGATLEAIKQVEQNTEICLPNQQCVPHRRYFYIEAQMSKKASGRLCFRYRVWYHEVTLKLPPLFRWGVSGGEYHDRISACMRVVCYILGISKQPEAWVFDKGASRI